MEDRAAVLFRLLRSGDPSAVISFFRDLTVNFDINLIFDEEGFSALHKVAQTNNDEVCRVFLVEVGEDLDVNLRSKNIEQCTPLHLAASVGNNFAVVRLLQRGAKTACLDGYGQSPYHVAVRHGHMATAFILVQESLSESIKKFDRETSLKLITEFSEVRKVLTQETVMQFFSNIIEMCVNYGDHRTVAAIMDRFDEAPHCIKPAYKLVNHVTVYLMLCRATLLNDTGFISALLVKDPPPTVHPHIHNIHEWRGILVPTLICHTMPLNPVMKIACRAGKASALAAILLSTSLLVKKSPMHSLNLSSLGLTEDVLHKCDLQSPDMLNFTTVNLSHNPIEALLPLPRTSFPALTRLLATDCQLKTVPAELFLLPALQEIRLTDNFLVELPDLPNDSSTSVVYLYLSYNHLTTIPVSFRAPKLQHLELQCNCLSEVPKAVLAMTNLRYLKLSNNLALRVIPFSIRWLQNLEQLVLDGMTIDNVPRLYTLPMALGYFKGLCKSIAGMEHFEAVFIGTGAASRTQADLVTAVRSLSTRYGFSVIFSPSPTLFLSTVETILKPPQVFVIAVNSDILPSVLTSLFRPVLKLLSVIYSKTEVVVASCCEVSSHSPSTSAKRKSELLNKQFMSEVEKLASQFPTCNIIPCPVNITISSQLANCDLAHFMKLLQTCNSKIATPTALPQYQSVFDRHFGISLSSGSSQDSTDSLPTRKRCTSILYGRALQESLDSIQSDPSLPEMNWLLQSLEIQGKLLTLCNRQGIVFDRQWLCDFVLRAINVVHINAFSREGFLPEPAKATIFSGLGLGDSMPPVLIVHLMHTGVAFPLNREVYFVPHTLKNSPESIPLDNTCSRVISAPILLPGFWNRLLAHLTMNTDALLKSASQDLQEAIDTQPPGQVLLEHWACGMVARRGLDQLCFAIRKETFTDEDAIGIIVPLSVSGKRLLTKLFNIVMSLLCNWYPSIWPGVKVWIPCSQCRLEEEPQSHFYPFLDCARRLISKEPLYCPLHKEADVFPLSLLPDLFSEALHGTFGTSIQLTAKVAANAKDVQNIFNPEAPKQEVLSVQSEFEQQLFMLLELNALKCPHLAVLQEVNLGHPPTLTCTTKEYIPLSSIIRQHGKIQRHLALHILIQAAEGLTALHTNGIIHRDISSHNILVQITPDDSAVDAKVSGFAHAANALYHDSLRGRCGRHPAPEMSWDKEQYEYDSRVDVYSLAFLSYEILTGKLLDPNQKEHSKPAIEPLASTAPLLLTTLHRMWQEEPGKRPYSSDLLHVFLQAQTLLPIKYKIVTGEKKCRPQCTVMSFPLPSSVSKSGGGGPVVFYGSIDEECCTHFQSYSSQDLAVQATRDIKAVDVVRRGCMLNNFLFAVHNLKTVSVFDMKQANVTKKLTFPSEVVSVDTDGVEKVVFGLNSGYAKVHVMGDSLEEFALQSTLTIFDHEAIQVMQCFRDSIFFASQSMVKAFNIHSLTETQCWLAGHVAMITVPFKPGTNESFGEIWAAHENSVKITILFTENGKLSEVADCSDCYVEECSYGAKAVCSLCAVADVVWVALSKGTVLLLDSTTRNPLTVLHLHSDYSCTAGALSVYPAPKVCVWPLSKCTPGSLLYKCPQPTHFTIFSTGIGLNSSVFTERHAKVTQFTPVLHHGLYIIAVASMTASEHLQLLEARCKNFPMEIFRLCHVNHAGAFLGNPSSTMRRYTEQVVPTFARRASGALANSPATNKDAYVAITPQTSHSRPLFTSKMSVRDSTAVHRTKEPTDLPPTFHRKCTFIGEDLFNYGMYSSKIPAIEEMEEYKDSVPSEAAELATVSRLDSLMQDNKASECDLPRAMTRKVKPIPKPRLKRQVSSESDARGEVQEPRHRHSSDSTLLSSGQVQASYQQVFEPEVNRQGACSELDMAVVVNENRSTELGPYNHPAVVTTALLPSAHITPIGPAEGSNARLQRGPIHRRQKLKKGAISTDFDGRKEAHELTTLPSTEDPVSSEEEKYEKMDGANILQLKQNLPTQTTDLGPYDHPAVVSTALLPSAHITPIGPAEGSNARLQRGPVHRRLKLKKGAVSTDFDGQKETYELTALPSTEDPVSDEEEEYEEMDNVNILQLKQNLPTQTTTNRVQSLQGHHCDASGVNNQATVYANLPHLSPEKTTKHHYANLSLGGKVGHEEEQKELGRRQLLEPPYPQHPSASRRSDTSHPVPPSKEKGGWPLQDQDSTAVSASVNAKERHHALELWSPYNAPPLAPPPHEGSKVQNVNGSAVSFAASVKEKTQSKHTKGEEQGAQAIQHQSNVQLSPKKVPLLPKRSHPLPSTSSSRLREVPETPYVNIRSSLDSAVVSDIPGDKTKKPSHHAYINLPASPKTKPPQPPPVHTKPPKSYHSQRSRDTDRMGYFKMTPTGENLKSRPPPQTMREDSRHRHRLDSTSAHIKVAEAEGGELEDTIEQPHKYF